MRKWYRLVFAGTLMIGMGCFIASPDAGAVNVFDGCSAQPGSVLCSSTAKPGQPGDNASSMVGIIINTLLYVIGILSIVMIVVGGINYTTSNGDSGRLKTARETILYAVVGLVVAILAYAIVNFVVGQFI